MKQLKSKLFKNLIKMRLRLVTVTTEPVARDVFNTNAIVKGKLKSL